MCQPDVKMEIRFIFSLSIVAVAYSPHITLSDYEATTSGCGKDCLSEGGIVFFSSTVNISKLPDTSVVINYDIKRKHKVKFELLCYLVIPDECKQRSNHYCSCQSMTSDGMYQVYINMSANKVNSEAHLRGELVYRQTSFYSEVRTLPTIYDFQCDLLNVYINDQLIDLRNCTTATNKSSTILVAKCFDDCPCILELIDSDTNQTLKYGHNIVSYETESKMNIKIRFEVCKKNKTVQCVITKESVKTNDQSEETKLLFLLILFILLVFAILAIMKRHFLNTVLQDIFNKLVVVRRLFRKLIKKNLKHCSFNDHKNDSLNAVERAEVLNVENSPLLPDILDPFQDSIKNDISKANTVCDIHVNPQHENTISFNMFTKLDLPVLYRNDILFQYIHAVSNLTGKITCLKDNNQSNQFLHLKRSSKVIAHRDMNEIDGLITDIDIFENGFTMFRIKQMEINCCPCNSCQKSSSPSKIWAEIFISTSKSNFNKHTADTYINITMYFEHLNLTMDGIFEMVYDDESEFCKMKFVTCDLVILDKVSEIKKMLDESIELNVKVNEHLKISREMDQIYISVSYLHSHTRYISIGEYTQTYLDYKTGSEIMYTPSLHPRSSGGPVILTGYSDRSGFCLMERSATGVCFKFSGSDVVLKCYNFL